MNGPAGTVIYLNGTSSSGKSSVARELQAILERPFAVFGSDDYRRMWGGRRPTDAAAMAAARQGFHNCIGALASSGNSVIVDSILLTDEHRAEVAALLHALPAYLVGVRCPLDVAEERELTRGDRRIGIARKQFVDVHAYGSYEVEVDTSVTTPIECALRIKEHVERGPGPIVFAALYQSPRGATGDSATVRR